MKGLCLVAAAGLLLFAGFCSTAAADDLSLGYTLRIDAPQTRTGYVSVTAFGQGLDACLPKRRATLV